VLLAGVGGEQRVGAALVSQAPAHEWAVGAWRVVLALPAAGMVARVFAVRQMA
jgi:hypothetical protein